MTLSVQSFPGRNQLERGYAEVELAVGQLRTEEFQCGEFVPLAVMTDGNLTGTSMTFESRVSDVATWLPVYDGANLVSVTVGPLRYIPLPAEKLYGIVRLRAVLDVAQAGQSSVLRIVCGRW